MDLRRIAAFLALAGAAWAAEIGFGVGGDFGAFYSKYHAKTTLYEIQYSGGSPVYGGGGILDIWFTDNLGIDLGVRYNTYKYTFEGGSVTDPDGVVTLNTLAIPLCLKLGYSMGPTRGYTGLGFSVLNQTGGTYNNTSVISPDSGDVGDSLLATELGVTLKTGFQVPAGPVKADFNLGVTYNLNADGARRVGSIWNLDPVIPLEMGIGTTNEASFIVGLNLLYKIKI